MKITISDLEKLYRNNKNTEVCRSLKISNPTLISLLKKAGLSPKGKGNRLIEDKVTLI